MNIMIRDIPVTTSERIKIEAERRKVSQQELLSALLEQHFGEPPLVVGYIKLDRLGDLAIGDDCPVCGEAAQSWWLQVASNGEMHHMCGACATSE